MVVLRFNAAANQQAGTSGVANSPAPGNADMAQTVGGVQRRLHTEPCPTSEGGARTNRHKGSSRSTEAAPRVDKKAEFPFAQQTERTDL